MSRYYTGHVGIIDTNVEIQAYLKEDIKATELLVVVPSNFKDTKRIERHTGYLKTLLGNIDIVFNKIIALTEDMEEEEMQELIKRADVVFLNGGDPNIQLEIINNNNLSESIRNTKAVVIGMSAGAMCMSQYSWMLPCNEEYPKMDIRNGMNLSGLSIYPHYNTNGKILDSYTNGDETTLKEDIIKSVEEYGSVYLLPDSSAIIERNDEILFVGPNIIFADKSRVEVINEDLSTIQL